MELKFERKDLRVVLMSAFPTQGRLELMVEDELGESLNQITQGEKDYELAMNALVKWAEKEGRLYNLIIGASVQNPGNDALQQFVDKNLQALLHMGSTPALSLLSSDVLAALIACLISITNSIDDVLSVCIQTLPDVELREDYSAIQGYLRNNELSSSVKWLVTLRLLLEYGKNSKGQLPIVTFVQNLQKRIVDGASKDALNTWLTNLPAELQPPVQTVPNPVVNQSRPADEELRNLRAAFVITVEPPGITAQTHRVRVNGYLVTEPVDENKLPKFHAIILQEPVDESSDKSIELRQQKTGLFCTLKQVEDSFPDWLLQAEVAIDARCTELQTDFNLDFRPIYDLTIEFWLPFEHLTAAADTWKIYSQPVRFKHRNQVVGEKHQVVVRSYDRFSDSAARTKLDSTWQKLDSFFQTSPDPAAVHQKFEHVDRWERWTAVKQKLRNHPFMGLTLTCPLGLDQYQEQRDDLFSQMLEEGIPTALWSRGSELTDHQEKMYDLLTIHTLSKLDQLLEQVKQTRRSANDDEHLGRHLAIWCDEPKRLMELERCLKKPGRLSA